ncbi:MAG: complex I NDUFA9 subunit family protein [Rhodospirillales bacterium]|nr:complex I NDUFA9 subunit family protein [Rhodospirillales bacterium]
MAEDDAAPKPKRRQTRKPRAGSAPPAAPATEDEGPAPAAPVEAEAAAAEEPVAEAQPLVVTIFGGTGFIGRRLVARLLEAGATVKLATRDPKSVKVPSATGGGSVEPVMASLGDQAAVAAAVAGSTAVVNLVGILYEHGEQTFASVHVEGARRIAAAAKAAGVGRLVHTSALGASASSRSSYARTKAAGEAAVREAFPEASIIRPSIVFGPEDDFFNRFASMAKISPALPLIGGGTTRFQPVYVDDVAAAIVRLLQDDGTAGQTYELGGPDVRSFKELLEMLLRLKKLSRALVPIPFFLAEVQGSFLQMLPTPPLTRGQVELLKTDNVLSGALPGLADLGITPTPLEAVLPTYL